MFKVFPVLRYSCLSVSLFDSFRFPFVCRCPWRFLFFCVLGKFFVFLCVSSIPFAPPKCTFGSSERILPSDLDPSHHCTSEHNCFFPSGITEPAESTKRARSQGRHKVSLKLLYQKKRDQIKVLPHQNVDSILKLVYATSDRWRLLRGWEIFRREDLRASSNLRGVWPELYGCWHPLWHPLLGHRREKE